MPTGQLTAYANGLDLSVGATRSEFAPPAHPLLALLQAALAKDVPVQYNKENPLNPFFVVYGKR